MLNMVTEQALKEGFKEFFEGGIDEKIRKDTT